jgi:hypothetical protein
MATPEMTSVVASSAPSTFATSIAPVQAGVAPSNLASAPAALEAAPDAGAPVYFHPAYNADPLYNDKAWMKDLATDETGRGQGSGYTMTWQDVNCTVTSGSLFTKKETCQALTDVSGYVRPGESLAVLGGS